MWGSLNVRKALDKLTMWKVLGFFLFAYFIHLICVAIQVIGIQTGHPCEPAAECVRLYVLHLEHKYGLPPL
jgi:hypothetical protein